MAATGRAQNPAMSASYWQYSLKVFNINYLHHLYDVLPHIARKLHNTRLQVAKLPAITGIVEDVLRPRSSQ